jgi:hypothetical protein
MRSIMSNHVQRGRVIGFDEAVHDWYELLAIGQRPQHAPWRVPEALSHVELGLLEKAFSSEEAEVVRVVRCPDEAIELLPASGEEWFEVPTGFEDWEECRPARMRSGTPPNPRMVMRAL